MTVQENDPPDLHLVILAVILLLKDVRDEVTDTDTLAPDTRLRLAALLHAVQRFKETRLP